MRSNARPYPARTLYFIGLQYLDWHYKVVTLATEQENNGPQIIGKSFQLKLAVGNKSTQLKQGNKF